MRLGEMLLERQFVSADDLQRALELQKERGEKIGKILIDGGYCAARDVMAVLAEQLRVPLVAIDGPPPVSPETEKLSPRFLRQFRCLPLALHDSSLTLAMADPLDFETLAAVRTIHGLACRSRARLRAGDPRRGRQILRRERPDIDSGFRGGRWPGRRGPRAPSRYGERGARHPAGERDDRAWP